MDLEIIKERHRSWQVCICPLARGFFCGSGCGTSEIFGFRINGNFRILKWRYVPTIYKAYFSGLSFSEYHHKIWPNIWYVYVPPCIGSWRSPIGFSGFLLGSTINPIPKPVMNCSQAIPKAGIMGCGSFTIPLWLFIRPELGLIQWYCTICLAIFSGDIPLHRPYIGLIIIWYQISGHIF